MSEPPHNYCKILGLDPAAEPEVVRAAYRELAATHHPDRGGDAERMRQINEAYEQLSDPARRATYDRTREAAPAARRPAGKGSEGTKRTLSRAELTFNLIVGAALAATLGVLAVFLLLLDLMPLPRPPGGLVAASNRVISRYCFPATSLESGSARVPVLRTSKVRIAFRSPR